MSKIAEELKRKIRRQAENRCGYCLLPQSLNPSLLEIEHILPTAKGGTDDEDNLWLSCRLCNGYKGVQTKAIDPKTDKSVLLFNPRSQDWNKHFKWNAEKIIGKTACGRATVSALKLNNEIILPVRKNGLRRFGFRRKIRNAQDKLLTEIRANVENVSGIDLNKMLEKANSL